MSEITKQITDLIIYVQYLTTLYIGCSGSSESWLNLIETILFAWVLEQLSLEFDAIPGMFCYFRHISL
jgi:hypothetical protein